MLMEAPVTVRFVATILRLIAETIITSNPLLSIRGFYFNNHVRFFELNYILN